MHLKLFEVAGTHLFSMSSIVIVLFFVFAIIVVGYLPVSYTHLTLPTTPYV